ncbi:hypothetical protein B0H10DRAFT_1981901 [Mycena sp. CBHHK59/15]|nr:hypothetical protein B0H10DRAFT_1981901 [Mycena sp. CBHHK59/15]
MSAPQYSDFSQYKQQRAALINHDRSLRADHSCAVSAAETKADKVVRGIRSSEAISVWGAEHAGAPSLWIPGRSIIMKTKLFELLVKMPKGALLHAHLDATVNTEFVLKIALEQPALHVRVPEPLTALNVSKTLPEFKALTKEMFPNSDASLTDTSYSPNTWISLQKARNAFHPDLGGLEGFDRWVIGALTINPTEAYSTHNTVDKIWEKFTSTFMVSTGLIRFAPVWKQYLYEFFRSSVEDGVSYVEVRINFFPEFMFGEDGQENIPHREWLMIFEEAQNKFKADLKSQGREDEFIGARIIYSTLRFITVEQLERNCEDCIALKQEFPHLIAGFDLVGPENVLKPLIYYAEGLLRFRDRQKELGIDIPFILHAGETLGDGTEADVNLYDAILLGTLRIGHGSNISTPRGIGTDMRKKITLSQRLTSSMPMHPLPILMNNGLPVALCSDDPACLGIWVFVASEVTGLTALRELARDSLKHSTLEPSEKQRAIAVWEKRGRICRLSRLSAQSSTESSTL